MEAKEGEANAAIYHQSRSKNGKTQLRRTKWITKDESDCDESSHDDESESETFQTSDDIY
jgi:hypothetical protein